MIEPPSRVLHYPVTAGCILAAAVVYLFAGGPGIDVLMLDARAFEGEPWRVFTTALVHGGFLGDESAGMGAMHLGFNAFWLWVFGPAVEDRWGHLRFGLFMVAAATMSSLAEYAILHTPVGLSGAGFALVAARYQLARTGALVHPVVPQRIYHFFVFWFFFSIALTVSGTLAIANIAHGTGALVGFGLASLPAGNMAKRAAVLAAFAVLGVALQLAAGPYRFRVNLAADPAMDLRVLGMRAIAAKDWPLAESRFKASSRYRNCPPEAWHNLGVTRMRQGKAELAAEAFGEATRIAPGDRGFSQALDQAQQMAERAAAQAKAQPAGTTTGDQSAAQ